MGIEKKKKKNTKMLTTAAMLTAVSVIIGIVCKNFLTFGIYYRITFENLPIILAGILFGPGIGAVCGAAADVLSCICSANPVVNPIITVGAACVGFCAGAVPMFIVKKRGTLQYALAVGTAHFFGQVCVKSIGKMLWYDMPWWGIFIGLGISAVVGVIEFFVLKKVIGYLPALNRGKST